MDLKKQLGTNLISVIETKLPAQTVIFVKKLDFIVVDLVRDIYGEKEKPLLFSLKELEDSKDVFCVDFLSMCADYHVVYGKDVLKQMTVDKKHVRHQLEYELRSKLITLRQRYLEAQEPKAILTFTIPTLIPLLRALLFLHDVPIPHKPVDILEKVFKCTGLSSPILVSLAKGKTVKQEHIGEIMEALNGFIDHCQRL